MPNIHDPSNNNDTDMRSSNNSTEENSNQTISSSYLTTRVEQPTALSQEATDMQLTGIEEDRSRQIDEFIRYEFIYFPALHNLTMMSILYYGFHVYWCCYWYCLLSMLFDIGFEYSWYLVVLELMLVDIGAFPRTTFDNEVITTMGRFQAWHRNPTYHHSFGSTRDGRAVDHMGHSMDTGAFLGIIVTFSPTVEEYWPPPRESIAVEDTQPHDMPPPIVLKIADRTQPEQSIQTTSGKASGPV